MIVTPESFGAVGDLIADDTTAVEAALAAAANQTLHLTQNYRLTAGLCQPVAAGITIRGENSELRWTCENGGLVLWADNPNHFHRVSDVKFTTAGTTGTALFLDYKDQIKDINGSLNTWDRYQRRFQLDRCCFHGVDIVEGRDPFTAWQNAVYSRAAIYGTIRDCHVTGMLGDTVYAPRLGFNGFVFTGHPPSGYENGHPCGFLVEGGSLSYVDQAVLFINCEGAVVQGGVNIVTCRDGVRCISEVGHPMLVVANMHANCTRYGVAVEGQAQPKIDGCTLYNDYQSPGSAGVYISPTTRDSIIVNNHFVAFTPQANGIVAAGNGGLIGGNTFRQVDDRFVTAIWLQPSSHSWKVRNDNIFDGAIPNTVLDQGSGNIIEL